MATVIFLGAGASVDAGYPPTANLLAEIKSTFENSSFSNEREDWKQFEKVRKNATGIARLILHSSNPEIVLTLPDLAEATYENEDREKWKRAKEALRQEQLPLAIRIQKKWYDSRNRQHLSAITNAKLHFQRIAQSFFLHKNFKDKLDEEAGQKRRAYLAKILSWLKHGDSVITTNWDILAERCLLEQNKWSPADGYGFPVGLLLSPDNPTALERANEPSHVRVLKLHGSAGWFRMMNNEAAGGNMYLRAAQYLEYLTPGSCVGRLRDRNEPNPGHGPDMNPVIMFPSFLKQLDDPVLQSILAQAAHVLNGASSVYFIGYSLPSADVAVRVLLNPLRFRLSKGDVSVTVVNPRKADIETWRRFIGAGADFVEAKANEFALRK